VSGAGGTVPESLRSADGLRKILPAKYVYSAGVRSGFVVFDSVRGLALQYLDKDGVPRRIPEPHQAWFFDNIVSRLKPSQVKRMFGTTETMRRRAGLYARLPANIRKALEDESVDPRRAHMESLDPGRPMPTDRSKVKDLKPNEIPREYTYVAMDPAPPRRHVFQSEFQIDYQGARPRPDEVIVSYEVTQKELDLLGQGKSFKDIKKNHPDALHGVKNFELNVWDDNARIFGRNAAEHVRWTARYQRAALAHWLSTTPLRPVGPALLQFTDILKDPAHYLIGETGASTTRTAEHPLGAEDTRAGPSKVHSKQTIDFAGIARRRDPARTAHRRA
jgi:hypothetical protein